MSKEAKSVKAGKAFKDAKPKGLIQHKKQAPVWEPAYALFSFLFTLGCWDR